MDDRQALTDTILANPDEDTPRLVFADWLDEHGTAGDRARAEFIRLQIDIARGRVPDRQRKAVPDRCAQLERANAYNWLAPFRGACGSAPMTGSFSRGFVSHVRGTWADLGRFPAIAAVCPVQWLEFDSSSPVPRDAGADEMAGCPALAHVRRLECRGFSETVANVLLPSPHLSGLHTLYLQWGWLNEGVERVSRSAAGTNLRHLWVWGSSVGEITPGNGLGTIVTAEWPALTQVRLDNLRVGDAGLLAVVRAFAERGRQAVHVAEQSITPAGAFTAVEAALAGNLPSVSISRSPDLRVLPEPVPDGARVLRFHWFQERGNTVVSWVVANVPPGRFDHIGLLGCRFGPGAARVLAGWSGLAGVKELDLRLNQIGDVGAAALAASPHLERVEHLLVAHNDITQKGKDALKKRFGRRVRMTDA